MGDWGKSESKKKQRTVRGRRWKVWFLKFKIWCLHFLISSLRKYAFLVVVSILTLLIISHAISTTFANSEPATRASVIHQCFFVDET